MEHLLISQLKAGNENAFRYLYDHYYISLCHLANEYVHDHYVAETLVGDLIFHLWEIRETLEIDSTIRSYLIKALRNRCLNYLNREQTKHEITFSQLIPNEHSVKDLDAMLQYADEEPLAALIEKEMGHEIQKAINRLSPECKVVFEKSRFEHKKYEEIAVDLGISVNTVKYHIKSALSSLRKELEKYILLFFLFLR